MNGHKVILFIFLIIGLLLRFYGVGSRSVWTDEIFTYFQATGHGQMQHYLDSIADRHPPAVFTAKDFKKAISFGPNTSLKDINNGLIKEDTHPPLYFYIIHFWMKLFGDGLVTVRLFSVIMGLIAVWLAYKVSQELFNKDIALFSALFVSISSYAIRFSQEARAYSLITVIGLCAWLFLLLFEKHRKNFFLILFAFFNCIGVYVHYFYILISVGQFVYFTITYRKESFVLDKFYVALLASYLFLSPWIALVMSIGYNFYLASWPFGYTGLIEKIYYLFILVSRYINIFEPHAVAFKIILCSGLVLVSYLSWPIMKEMRSKYARQVSFCLYMFLTPALTLFLVDLIQKGILLKQERFLVFSFIGFIPLMGCILYGFFTRSKMLGYVSVIFILSFVFITHNKQFGPSPKDISSWINEESAGKPAAVIMCNLRSVITTQVYGLKDSLYVIPVYDEGQLKSAIEEIRDKVERVFIVRHFIRDGQRFVDREFMATKDIGSAFKFNKIINNIYIEATEFIKIL